MKQYIEKKNHIYLPDFLSNALVAKIASNNSKLMVFFALLHHNVCRASINKYSIGWAVFI